jgi:hypothetical protein
MVILFWVVLVLFSIVQSKIVHYSSLCYFPLTYLAALTLSQLETGRIAFNGWLVTGLLVIGAIFVIAFTATPILALHMDIVRAFADKDAFSQGNLNADVHWTLWAMLPGIWLAVVLGVSIWGYIHKQARMATLTLFGGTAIFLTLGLWFYVGRVEGISQDAAMRYFERAKGKNVYVSTYDYHSYGPFFYTQTQPAPNPKHYDKEWLLTGPIDRDVWLIRKASDTPTRLDSLPDVRKTGEENGFIFYLRKRH